MNKKIIRAFTAIVLLLSVLISSTLSCLATNRANASTVDYGYTFAEDQLDDDTYVLFSYYQGTLRKKYTISRYSPTISVQVFDPQLSNIERVATTYTIESAVSNDDQAVQPYAERWASVGYINYRNHVGAGDVRAYTMAYGNNTMKQQLVRAKSGDALDDIVSFLVSTVISYGLDALVTALGYASNANFCYALLMSAISATATEIVDGIFKSAFGTTVKVYETVWDFKFTPFNGYTSIGSTSYLYSQGTTYLVMHDDIEWDTYSEGFTLSDWKHSEFAAAAWRVMFPSYTYPGVLSYTSN